jgi:hypothetical protein
VRKVLDDDSHAILLQTRNKQMLTHNIPYRMQRLRKQTKNLKNNDETDA